MIRKAACPVGVCPLAATVRQAQIAWLGEAPVVIDELIGKENLLNLAVDAALAVTRLFQSTAARSLIFAFARMATIQARNGSDRRSRVVFYCDGAEPHGCHTEEAIPGRPTDWPFERALAGNQGQALEVLKRYVNTTTMKAGGDRGEQVKIERRQA